MLSPYPEYDSFGHDEQVLAGLLEYVPGVQSLHLLSERSEYPPTLQVIHRDDFGGETFTEPQRRQLSDLTAAYDPAGQSTHDRWLRAS